MMDLICYEDYELSFQNFPLKTLRDGEGNVNDVPLLILCQTKTKLF